MHLCAKFNALEAYVDLKRMQHVIALAEERNFGKAAERVHLTQPAFSRSIQAAEQEWGMKLFDRGGRAGVGCTVAGARIVERMRRVVGDWRALERDVLLYRDQQIGELALGIGLFVAGTLLMPLLLDLRKHRPGVKVRAHVNNARVLLQFVRNEEHDFFFGDIRYVRNDPAFAVTAAGGQVGAFFVCKGHPLLSKKPLLMADLAPFGFCVGRLPEEVQSLLIALMGRTPEEGLPVAVECDDLHLVKSIAMSTEVIMVGTPALVSREVAAGELHVLSPRDLPVIRSEIGVVSLRGRTLSPIATYAADFLSRLAAKEALPRTPRKHQTGP